MLSLFISTAFTIFVVMDPIGNIPAYLSLLKHLSSKRRSWVIVRESVIALVVMMLFVFVGDSLFKALSISQTALSFTGGILLFIISMKMINGKSHELHISESEPLIFPLAIPLVSGPSVIAIICVLSSKLSLTIMLLSLFFAWIASTIILLLGGLLESLMGERTLKAMECLAGLILMVMSINIMIDGYYELVNNTP